MKLDINVNATIHVHHHGSSEVIHKLDKLIAQGERMMATQAELTTKVNELTTQVTKVGTETRTLLTKIEELLAVIAAGTVTPELEAAVNALKDQVQVVDDLVVDATP